MNSVLEFSGLHCCLIVKVLCFFCVALARRNSDIISCVFCIVNTFLKLFSTFFQNFFSKNVECILKILENKDGCADGKIFNIGNPDMEYSIKELAEMLIELFGEYPEYADAAKNAQIKEISAKEYYGEGYADVSRRVPSVKQAEEVLGWKPSTDLRTALKLTLDYHLLKKDYELAD